MATIEELKEIIVDLKVSLGKANVPRGNCPYAYYPGIEGECREDSDCDKCEREFWQKYRTHMENWVASL